MRKLKTKVYSLLLLILLLVLASEMQAQINSKEITINIVETESLTLFYIPIDWINNFVVKAEQVRTPNVPIVNIISPEGGEVYYKDFTINWSASDADNDKLSYAVLLSNDNGVSWSTLAVDYDQTSFLVNVSYLEEGDKYLVKVLATDGINTGMDVSDSVFTVKRKDSMEGE